MKKSKWHQTFLIIWHKFFYCIDLMDGPGTPLSNALERQIVAVSSGSMHKRVTMI